MQLLRVGGWKAEAQGTALSGLSFLLPRVLLLCAALLALPATVAAQCSPAFTFQRVWTQDTGGTAKTTFAPGETIQFAVQVSNIYGGSGATTLNISTSFYSNSKQVNLPIGLSNWGWNATAPATPGNYNVAVSVLDNFCGQYVPGSASFTVSQPTQTQSPTQPSSCPTPLVRFNQISGNVGATITESGSGWVPGGTVKLTLPYGSKALFTGSTFTPQVSNTGEWQITFTVDPKTPPGDYVSNVDEETSDCTLSVHPTFTVPASPTPQAGAFGAVISCQGAPFVFPVPAQDENGKNSFIGWLYKEPSTDPSGPHSGLDLWVAEGTPVMAVATGYVSRPVEPRPGENEPTKNAYALDIYYPDQSVETYTDNLVNVQVQEGTTVTAGMIIGFAGSYLGHIHWSIGTKGYNDQSADFTSTTPHRDPTPYLAPAGNLDYTRGAVENRSVPLSWWCTLH